MNVQLLPIDSIKIGSRARPAYQDQVEALAASIQNCATAGIGYDGLRHPVEVYTRGNGFALIAGMHRMMAVEHLGRVEIAAAVLDVDAVTARQLELEENLVRADLTKLDRAMFVAGYRDLFEAEHGVVMQGGNRKSIDFKDKYQNADIALWSDFAMARLSMGKRNIEGALRIAKCLHPDVVQLLRATKFADNQKALLELCGTQPDGHIEVVMRLLDPKSGFDTMREAIRGTAGPSAKDKDELWFRKTLTRVRSGSKRAKKRLFHEIILDTKDFETLREVAREGGFTIEPLKGWKGPK